MEQGLAAVAASGGKSSGMYGDGKQNTVQHNYGGTIKSKKKKGK